MSNSDEMRVSSDSHVGGLGNVKRLVSLPGFVNLNGVGAIVVDWEVCTASNLAAGSRYALYASKFKLRRCGNDEAQRSSVHAKPSITAALSSKMTRISEHTQAIQLRKHMLLMLLHRKYIHPTSILILSSLSLHAKIANRGSMSAGSLSYKVQIRSSSLNNYQVDVLRGG